MNALPESADTATLPMRHWVIVLNATAGEFFMEIDNGFHQEIEW